MANLSFGAWPQTLIALACILSAGCGGHQDQDAGGGSPGGTNPPAVAPQISAQPTDTTVQSGQTATFVVSATGTPQLTYQWMRNGVSIPGATAAAYVTDPLTTANSGDTYSVTVANSAGSIASRAATLTVTGVATATLAPSVRILTDSEESQIVAASAMQVTFSNAMTLAPGTVVLGTSHAFKVLSSATVGSQTVFTVSEPTLGELFSSLVIQGSYTADPSMAVPGTAGVRSALKKAMPADSGSVTDTLSWPYSFSDGGFTLNATLTSTIGAFIDYNFQDGAVKEAILDVSADSQVALSESYTENAMTSYEKQLGEVTIPINVSVVDSTLASLGIRLVALKIPVYAGATLGSSFEMASNQTLDVSGSVNLTYDPTNGPNAQSTFTGTLSLGTLTPSAPSGQSTSATLSERGSIYVRMAPALAFVDTIALLGVDTKLSLDDANSLQIVSNTPPYCLSSVASVNVAANGFFKALGIAPLKTDEHTATLYTTPSAELGSCQAPIVVTASTTATQPSAYRASVPINVTIAVDSSKTSQFPSSPPTGTVLITAQGASCQAAVSTASDAATSASASCSLAPLASGPTVPVSVSYSGDSRYAAGTTQIFLDISDSQYTLLGSPVTLIEEEPLGTDQTQPTTVRAGPGVAFSSGNLVTLQNRIIIGSTLTVGENYIDISYNMANTADTSSFNGPVFTFGSGAPPILGCSLDPQSTYTTAQVGVTCAANQVTVNGSGISTMPGSRILVDLQLAAPSQ